VLKRLGMAVLTAVLAAVLVVPNVDTRIWLALFAVAVLGLSGTLLDTRWSRENIAWLQTPRTRLRALYRDLYQAKGELAPYKDGAPHFPHAEWRERINALEQRYWQTMSREVDYLWQHEQRHLQTRLEMLDGLDAGAAARKMHTLLNERLDVLAKAMREPGLD